MLRDALAAALLPVIRSYEDGFAPSSYPTLADDAREQADAILADSDFRAALSESLAHALLEADGGWWCEHNASEELHAAAVLAVLLDTPR